VTLSAPVDCTVALFLSKNDVSLGFADGSAVNVSGQVQVTNGVGARVPVDIGGGVVTVTADNVGISNTNDLAVPVRNQALSVLLDIANVVVGVAAASVSNDATLRRLRFRNESVTARIGLGGAGVTMAKAAVIIGPGEMWIEDDAAGANWYAISDTAGADLRMFGVK
jgi:hypothetical protein